MDFEQSLRTNSFATITLPQQWLTFFRFVCCSRFFLLLNISTRWWRGKRKKLLGKHCQTRIINSVVRMKSAQHDHDCSLTINLGLSRCKIKFKLAPLILVEWQTHGRRFTNQLNISIIVLTNVLFVLLGKRHQPDQRIFGAPYQQLPLSASC